MRQHGTVSRIVPVPIRVTANAWPLLRSLLIAVISVSLLACSRAHLTAKQSLLFSQVRAGLPAERRDNLQYALYKGAFILYDRAAPLPGRPTRFHVIGSCHLSYAPLESVPLRIEAAGCQPYGKLQLLALMEYDKDGVTRPWRMGLAGDPLPHPENVLQAMSTGRFTAPEKRVASAVLIASAPADRSNLMFVVYRSTLLLFYGDAAKLNDWQHCTEGYSVIGTPATVYFPCPNGGPGFLKGIHVTAMAAGDALTPLGQIAVDAYAKEHLPALWTRPWGYFF